MWDRREALHQSRLADSSSAYNPVMQQALDRLHHLGLGDLQAYGLLARTLSNQAYLLAADDLFWLSGCLSIGLIAVVWMAKRAAAPTAAPVAAH